MLGHAQHDAQRYVPAAELEEWAGRDPLRRFDSYLLEHGFGTAADLASIDEGIAEELEQAVDRVLSEAYPTPAEAITRVYEDSRLDPEVPWTRRTTVGYEDLRRGQARDPAMEPR